MKTIPFLLTALLGFAMLTPASAQVYTVNVVGYINLDLPAGYSLIANQLDNARGNLVKDLIPEPPMGMSVYKFNGAGYDQLTALGTWIGDQVDTMTLAPGEGAFFRLPEPAIVTFVGEVMQGDLAYHLTPGWGIYSSMVPQSAPIEEVICFPANWESAVSVFRWNGSGFDQSTLLPGGVWLPSEPVIMVGEAFWIHSPTDREWVCPFVVNALPFVEQLALNHSTRSVILDTPEHLADWTGQTQWAGK